MSKERPKAYKIERRDARAHVSAPPESTFERIFRPARTYVYTEVPPEETTFESNLRPSDRIRWTLGRPNIITRRRRILGTFIISVKSNKIPPYLTGRKEQLDQMRARIGFGRRELFVYDTPPSRPQRRR